MLATDPGYFVQETSDPVLKLFPHRFDYIYAHHPEPGTSPHWQTETRHPLADRLLQQGSYLYGVRFGQQTQYCLLDIDRGSPYHPATDPFAIQRIGAALESVGLVSYLVCTSSYSGGLHLYFPFQASQNSWELGTAITVLLENAGLTVKPGLLEVFPNRKGHSHPAKPSLFNAHRLPLQAGSYLLNRDLEPVWSDHQQFVQQWRLLQLQNQITPGSLKQILKRQRRTYQISGKAAKFLNDLNAEIELGWTDHGQTNYLLGRIAMRTYVFHHILESGAPLEGQALIDQIISVARSLPGYEQWCRHQHEIEHRASEWARCVESSRYFHYGEPKRSANHLLPESNNSEETSKAEPRLSWNQQQLQQTRDRIRKAIADLLEQNALPVLATARFKALTQAGIGGGSLYRHKDLWHPDFLRVESEVLESINLDSINLDSKELDQSELIFAKDSARDQDFNYLNGALVNLDQDNLDQDMRLNADLESSLIPLDVQANFTNLFPSSGSNASLYLASSALNLESILQTGCNSASSLSLYSWMMRGMASNIHLVIAYLVTIQTLEWAEWLLWGQESNLPAQTKPP